MLGRALFIVDHEGRIEYSNRLAAALVKAGRVGLTLARGEIGAKSHTVREQLMDAVHRACKDLRATGFRIPETGTPADRWPLCIVVPVAASGTKKRYAAIWIIEIGSPTLPDESLLSALFHLSPAEGRLAIGLLKGSSPAEYARQSRVAVATIRSQLHSMFSKTGVRRQSQLVALLAKVPSLSPDTEP